MKKDSLRLVTRIAAVISGVCLFSVLYFPVWRIELNAPQYPEGLCLQIHANGIRGDVNIINGLNHYIGMRSLHDRDFPEFLVLPYCIIFFSVLFLLTALVNRKKLLVASTTLYAAFGVLAMVDFWKWEYNYGHNLDPHAAIVVPGMAYQPPLIGFKQLLNFGAYSVPDVGGILFILSGVLMLGFVILEYKWKRKSTSWPIPAMAALISVFTLVGCNKGPEAIRVGKDNCASCRMTIEDPRFGAELITSRGVVYKFDDIHCLQDFLGKTEPKQAAGAKIYFSDFCNSHNLVEAQLSWLLKSQDLRCPMDGHLAAFSNTDSLKVALDVYHGEIVKWTNLQ